MGDKPVGSDPDIFDVVFRSANDANDAGESGSAAEEAAGRGGQVASPEQQSRAGTRSAEPEQTGE